jgi:hypothetical protein
MLIEAESTYQIWPRRKDQKEKSKAKYKELQSHPQQQTATCKYVSRSKAGAKAAQILEGRSSRRNSGLGNRSQDPTPAYLDSLRPTPAKVGAKSELWLEWAGMRWSEMELSTI